VKCKYFLAHCENDFLQSKPINNPAAWLLPGIPCSESPSIQQDGSVGDWTSQDHKIINRIKRCIMATLLII